MSNGKGSKPRPYSVSYSQYCDNYDNIFRKKKDVSDTNPKSKKNYVIANPNWKARIYIIPNEDKENKKSNS